MLTLLIKRNLAKAFFGITKNTCKTVLHAIKRFYDNTYFLSVDRYVVSSKNDISFASDRIGYLSHLTMPVIHGLFPLRLVALRAKEKFLIVW